jgi:Rrf2 family protein
MGLGAPLASTAARLPYSTNPIEKVEYRQRAGQADRMKISAKSDYAIRAVAHLAACDGARVKADELAHRAHIPKQFLENILAELRRAGIVRAHRGSDGGYELARPANDIDIATVLAAVGSPLADGSDAVRDATVVDDVWLALRSATRSVLERVTLADLVRGTLPANVRELALAERARAT